MTEQALTPRSVPWLTSSLAVAGLAISGYLTYVHYTEPAALSCPDTGVVNCTKVTTSPESMVFGVLPVALLGTLYFAVLLPLLAPAAWRARASYLPALRVAAVLGGVGMVCYLVYVEAAVVHALCLWCTAVHVVTFALFVAVLFATLVPPLPDS